MGHFSVSVKLFKEALPVLSIVSDQSIRASTKNSYFKFIFFILIKEFN